MTGKLPEWVRHGASFTVTAGPRRRLYHIRGIVDDDQAVLREWISGKQRWNYTVEGPEFFDVYEQYIKVQK